MGYTKSMENKVENKYLRHIGKRIREARMALGRTQKEQAAMLGIQPSTWSQYESGINDLSTLRLIEIAESLGIFADYFLVGIPDFPMAEGDTQQAIAVRVLQIDPVGSPEEAIAVRVAMIERLAKEIGVIVQGKKGDAVDALSQHGTHVTALITEKDSLVSSVQEWYNAEADAQEKKTPAGII